MTQITAPNAKQLAEILAAAPDAVASIAGYKPRQPHPLAERMKLLDLAFACAAKARKPRSSESRLAFAGFGLGTMDFPTLLADGLKHATVASYDAQAAHAAYCARIAVEDFHPLNLPALDGGIELEELAEGARCTSFVGLVAAGGIKVQLRTFARKIGLTRQSVINNDLAAFARSVISTGATAARIEARLVAAELEKNRPLDDESPVFHADFLNVVGSALSQTSLGQALGCLRKQKTSAGQLADLAGRHLVVEPDLEMTARELVRNAGLDLQVSVLAHLPAGRWYLLAAPDAHPVIGLLRLHDSRSPIRVEPQRRPQLYDGAVVGTVADVGACLLRRTGIVRGGSV